MFTIIFPVLNERLRLENGVTRTVEYLRSIAFEDYEIIIVDNGSEDETPQIAEKLCKKYDKVRYERINVSMTDIMKNPNDISVIRLIHPSTGRTVLKIEYTIQPNMITMTENRITLTNMENFSSTLVNMISVSSARLLRVLRSSLFLPLLAMLLLS